VNIPARVIMLDRCSRQTTNTVICSACARILKFWSAVREKEPQKRPRRVGYVLFRSWFGDVQAGAYILKSYFRPQTEKMND